MQYGDTALHKACSRGDHNTVDLLIKAGANVDIVNNVSLSYDNVYHFMYFSKKRNKISNIVHNNSYNLKLLIASTDHSDLIMKRITSHCRSEVESLKISKQNKSLDLLPQLAELWFINLKLEDRFI